MALTRHMIVKTRADISKKYIPPSTKCLFLALPAELRIRIYEYAMAKDCTEGIVVGRTGIQKKFRPGSLIFTCYQIKDEALPVYFKVNKFQFKYGYIAGPISKLTYKMCRGWMREHIKGATESRIETDQHDRFVVTWNVELNKYVVDTPAFGVLISVYSPWMQRRNRFKSEIRRLLDHLLDTANKRGAEVAIDGDGMIELMELLADDWLRDGTGIYLKAELVSYAAVST